MNGNMIIKNAAQLVTCSGFQAKTGKIESIDAGKEGDVIILEFPSYQYIPYHIGVSTVEKVIKKGNLVFDAEKRGITYC